MNFDLGAELVLWREWAEKLFVKFGKENLTLNTNAGNIAIATTAVVGKALTMTYDSTTTKWYPSY